MNSSRKEHKFEINLTHHLKIWFGKRLKEEHILRLIDQKRRNPAHNIILVVNPAILANQENAKYIRALNRYGIEVVDINKAVGASSSLQDQRMFYLINEMIQKGLEKEGYYKPFAAASDLARWMPALVKYKCEGDHYRVYSDTDYFFYTIPLDVRLEGEYLFGEYDTGMHVVFKHAEGLDGNFIAIHPDHPLAERIRAHWIHYFGMIEFYPPGNEKPSKSPSDAESLDADDDTFVAVPLGREDNLERKREIAWLINSFSDNPGINVENILQSDVLGYLRSPKALLCQRLDQVIVINLNEASHITGGRSIKILDAGKVRVDSVNDSELTILISKEAVFKNELLCLLARGGVISVETKRDYQRVDFAGTIAAEKVSHAMAILTAFVEARKLHHLLEGNKKEQILSACLLPAPIVPSFSSSSHIMFSPLQVIPSAQAGQENAKKYR